MNLKEGTRRLALLLGVIGAILGSFISWSELQSVLSQRTLRARFEQLSTSDAVQREQGSWALQLHYAPKNAIEHLQKLSDSQQIDVLRGLSQDGRNDLLAKLDCASSAWGVGSITAILENLSRVYNVPKGAILVTQRGKGDPYACLEEESSPPSLILNERGIKTIHLSKDLIVESIETEDGQTLYPIPEPHASNYLLIALLPVVGFLVPWAAVLAAGWVGTGFLTTK